MGWVARNLVIAIACAVAGFVIVALAGAAGLRADGEDPIGAGEPLTLVYSINATPFGYVTDQDSIDPGRTARVGLLARDGVAQFDDFALYLAD